MNFLIALLLPLIVTAAPKESPSSSQRTYSVAPIFAYDSAYGGILGGAIFFPPTPPRLYFLKFQGMFTFSSVFQGITEFETFFKSPWGFGLDANYSNFYAVYFGEGGDTDVASVQTIDSETIFIKPYIKYYWTRSLKSRLFYETRKQTVLKHPAPLNNEDDQGYGTDLTLDTKNDRWSPSSGGEYRAGIKTIQPNQNRPAFSQTELDLRQYLPGGFRRTVLALRGFLGTSSGIPSYLYAYRLGGDLVRGYWGNRFRDANVLAFQLDYRFPLFQKPMISGVIFADSGTVAPKFENIEKSESPFQTGYGFGLRFGLPPKGNIKVRADMSFGKDQTSFRINFGEVF